MINYLNSLRSAINCFQLREILEVCDIIYKAKTVYVIGNGGSQSMAEHFTVDLLKFGNKRAISISNTGYLTMASNDFGFERAFRWYLDKNLNKGDVVFAMTTSGKSPNVLESLIGNLGVKSILMAGIGGADIAQDMDASIIINSRDTQVIEDSFSIICHIIAMELNRRGK